MTSDGEAHTPAEASPPPDVDDNEVALGRGARGRRRFVVASLAVLVVTALVFALTWSDGGNSDRVTVRASDIAQPAAAEPVETETSSVVAAAATTVPRATVPQAT